MKLTSQSYPSTDVQPTKFIVSGLGTDQIELYPTRSEDGSVKLDYTLSDLPDGEYQVQAVAVGNNLTSNASEPLTVTVKNSPPAVPTLSIQ